MTLSLQEISDRLEITDTITRYSHGLDQRQWDVFHQAFTADAVIDFSTVGMDKHSPTELQEIFTGNDPTRISGQHLLTNTLIEVDGDIAKAGSEYSVITLSTTDEPNKAKRVTGGGRYTDDLVRTPEGWRIKHRSALIKWAVVEEIDWQGPSN